MDRNSIVGLDFLTIGLGLAALGYIGVQSAPIAALGFALAILGALLLLVVPEPVPQDAMRALLKDAIRNMEIILEETQLRSPAYFVPLTSKEESVGEVRAFIPMAAGEENSIVSGAMLLQSLNRAPRRFITSYAGLRGLVLIPPGNEIARLAKVQKDADLEESLRSVLVDFSDLAASLLLVEQAARAEISTPDRAIEIQISRPSLSSDSPYFNGCLGSPVSCVAACVVSLVRMLPVMIVRERYDPSLIMLTLRVIE